MTNPKLYPFPAAGTAALVSRGLLLSFPGLDMPVQRGPTYTEGTANLRDRVSLIVIEGLGNTDSFVSEGFGSAAFSPSGSGCGKARCLFSPD